MLILHRHAPYGTKISEAGDMGLRRRKAACRKTSLYSSNALDVWLLHILMLLRSLHKINRVTFLAIKARQV